MLEAAYDPQRIVFAPGDRQQHGVRIEQQDRLGRRMRQRTVSGVLREQRPAVPCVLCAFVRQNDPRRRGQRIDRGDQARVCDRARRLVALSSALEQLEAQRTVERVLAALQAS